MDITPLGKLARTHTNGELTAADAGANVVLLGWVHRVRDLGSLVFIDLRDRHGLTQIVVRDNEVLTEAAKRLRAEYVIAVIGTVHVRAAESANARMKTGGIEVAASEIRLLNDAKVPPFGIADETTVSEDMRLRYRYLDLRRPRMQHNIALRHKATMAIRTYLDEQGFLEIETPILAKSTPEGARDYLVPSRVHPGEFYALPQSPQIFKQILMISGMDRYFQIARCFRDEDLRADRQPEFTQVDLEMSFATEDLIFATLEPLMQRLMTLIGREAPARPFRRLPYAEAIAKYGSDKPDLRPGMEIQDLSPAFADSAFSVFKNAIAEGGEVRGFAIPGAAKYSRREVDELVEQAKQLGATGLVWARAAESVVQSSALKAAGEDAIRRALQLAGAAPSDLIVMAAGPHEATSKVLGQLRLNVAKKENLLDPDKFEFLWVVDFPMFEWQPEEQRYEFMHHPFTAPLEGDRHLLETDQGRARARAYDLVLNGSEIAGGSIRIHDQAVQRLIFKLLGISDEEAKLRFGFFVDALDFGTPPHGGIAIGLDRVVAILCGEASIRDVIAFPKTAQAVDLMSGAPSPVDPKQLRDLKLRTEGK